MADAVHIDRSAGEATITCYQGTDCKITFDVSGAAADIDTAAFTIKTMTGVAALALTEGSGITQDDSDTITVALTTAQTAALGPTAHRYDLHFTLTNADELTWVSGIFDVKRQV